MHVYDVAQDRWRPLAPLALKRGAAAAVAGSAIDIPAGDLVNGGSRPSTTNEAFVLS